MKQQLYRYSVGVFVVVLLLVVLPACGLRPAPTTAGKPVIKLVVNSWQASELNALVAKILLEEEMGYPVEFVYLDEDAQWEALAAGTVHANLEVWEAGRQQDIQQYVVQEKTVLSGGALGPVGRIGWYMPAYILAEHSELINGESLRDPQLAGLFATPATGGKGQFLAGDPSWVQFDEQIIQNLGLHLQVVRVGTEEAILAELEAAYAQQQPLLFYLWDPHWALAQYELVRVTLPPHTAECYMAAEAAGVDCDYPAERLLKVYWPGLPAYAPDAYAFLDNFYYTNSDQIEMLNYVHEGMSLEQAARTWIEAHRSLATFWLP